MKKIHFFLYILLLIHFYTYSQTNKKIKGFKSPILLSANLANEVNETSGLIYFRNKIWTINDSGGKPCIYALDSTYNSINQIVEIKNAKNIDWEEIAQDNSFIYIGDIGNNFGNRDVLTIYKISKTDIPYSGKGSVDSKKIEFSYKNKTAPTKLFPFSANDCEAFVVINDTIHLFSKDWTNNTSTYYQFPAIPGKYILDPLKTIETNGLITAATVQPNTNIIVLLGYRDFLPFVIAINKSPLKSKQNITMVFPSIFGYQTEGIAFINDSTLIITSEAAKNMFGSVFEIEVVMK